MSVWMYVCLLGDKGWFLPYLIQRRPGRGLESRYFHRQHGTSPQDNLAATLIFYDPAGDAYRISESLFDSEEGHVLNDG
jgi:hypothetical protein